MALFIELTTDAFQDTFNKQKASSDRARRAGTSNARRPMRGLEVKDDTYAVIKVVTSSGQEIPLIDSGSPNGMNTQYTNFILQSVQEARMEKNQIVETFGESYIFFFGEAPRFLDVQAVLIDSNDFNWYAEFWANYDQYLRGTQSVALGARTYLFYDDNIVEGYMLQAQAVKTSDTPLMVRLQFRLYLTNYQNISFVGDPNFPVRGSLQLPQGVSNVNQFATDQQALDLTLAANLQMDGFGGGQSLVQALQQGAVNTNPALSGIVSNAAEAFGGVGGNMPAGLTRQQPLRGLISSNTDEYTGAVPTPVPADNGSDSTQPDQAEAQDLTSQSMGALQQMGASFDPASTSFDQQTPYLDPAPAFMQQMGLGPRFYPGGQGIGFGGLGGVGSAGATFGASAGALAGFGTNSSSSIGGIGGGLGFSGRSSSLSGFGASVGYAVNQGYTASLSAQSAANVNQPGTLQDQLIAASFKDILDYNFTQVTVGSADFIGGVRVAGSLTSGVGVAGGVSGGLNSSSIFTAYPVPGPGLTPGIGNGANVNIGGAPSAFAMVSVAGTLDPYGFDPNDSSFSRAGF